MENKHSSLVVEVSEAFQRRGISVEKEVSLPNGRGAVDLAVRGQLPDDIFGEVKSSPACVQCKRVRMQLEKYKSHFGLYGKYVLFSPGADGEIRVEELGGEFRGSLGEYFQYIYGA